MLTSGITQREKYTQEGNKKGRKREKKQEKERKGERMLTQMQESGGDGLCLFNEMLKEGLTRDTFMQVIE